MWTSHSKGKMLHYRLSDQRIKTAIHSPQRTELGVAPRTIAVMKRNDTQKRKEEIWVMYQKSGSKKKIISVWRYPGISPKRAVPLPEGLLEELHLLD